MGSSPLDEFLAFRKACINRKMNASDLVKSLGLRNFAKGRIKFTDQAVINLYQAINTTAQNYIETHRVQEIEGLREEGGLKDAAKTLTLQYGEAIWGRATRDHLLRVGEEREYPKALRWSHTEDRESIQYYLHCWVLLAASRRISKSKPDPDDVPLLPRKDKVSASTSIKEKTQSREYRTSVARMYSTPEPQRSSGVNIEPRQPIIQEKSSRHGDTIKVSHSDPSLLLPSQRQSQSMKKRVQDQEVVESRKTKLPRTSLGARPSSPPIQRLGEGDANAFRRSPSTTSEYLPSEDESDPEIGPLFGDVGGPSDLGQYLDGELRSIRPEQASNTTMEQCPLLDKTSQDYRVSSERNTIVQSILDPTKDDQIEQNAAVSQVDPGSVVQTASRRGISAY